MMNPEWSELTITGPGIYRTSEGRRVIVQEHDAKDAPLAPRNAAEFEVEPQKAASAEAEISQRPAA